MNSRIVRKTGRKVGVQIVVWSLCLLMVSPPALLAQSLGAPGAPPLGTSFPGGGAPPGGGAAAPGQAIVTNPTALQPIAPGQAPCPAPTPSTIQPIPPSPRTSPGGGQVTLPGGMVQTGTGFAQAGTSGVTQGLQAGQAGIQFSQGLQATQGGPPGPSGTAGAPSQGNASIPTHPGLLSPVIQQQGAAGALQQPQPEGVGQLSIEEGFARFFILQGVTGQLKQFGYSFFDVQFSGFPPVMDTPVGPDYILGPDDTLSLHVWNVPDSNFNRSYITPVERDGTIFIPQVGSIPVAGTSFSQVTRLIHSRLSGLLKRFEMHVSMARLRTIKVYVVGEVVRPGAYELSSLATASHALYGACGPSKSGSLRRIQVVRDGKTVSELDFYRFFLQGDRTQDVRLQSGDTILVPPIGAVAAIGGPVKRPAIYELKDRTVLTELIDLAGGLSPTADRKRCQIFRVEAGQQRVILDVNLGPLVSGNRERKSTNLSSGKPEGTVEPIIQDGDFVRIAAVPTQIENAVSLAGAVRNPGPFEFRPGMRLSNLLTSEQMLVDSYMDRAELVRTDPVSYETTVLAFSPKALFQGKEENIELRRLDKVLVATQVKPPRIVSVMGEVKRPGSYTIESGERLSSVLKRAGGLTVRAFPKGIIFIRESVRRSQQTEVEKFVTLQKQRLISEAAALTAGNPNLQGAPAGGLSPEQASLQIQMQALDQLIARIQPGRVVVKMESLDQPENSLEDVMEDVMLEEGDQITIPQQPQTVNIVGAVRNPTSVVYHKNLHVEDYLRQAGGTTDYAREKEIYILRAEGSTEAAYARIKEVGPGDTIVVPERIEPKTRPLPLWQAVASILGNMMMAVAAIAIIGRP